MEATEKRLIVVLADISGYTKFMVENQMSAIHGQQCITFLIETLLREVDIPLHLQEIEGDALFLYAEDPGHADEWDEVLAQVRIKLTRFFDAFYEGTVLVADATPCKCAICKNAKDLGLKIIVHSGTAVFHQIGGFDKVSGPDVILAHRLLKNSVPEEEYLLMTDVAYKDIGQKMDGQFLESSESYEAFGKIKTHVKYTGEAKAQLRETLYQLPRTVLSRRAGSIIASEILGMFPALVTQMRKPDSNIGWIRRIGFALSIILRAPIMALVYAYEVPRRLFLNRADIIRARTRGAGSA